MKTINSKIFPFVIGVCTIVLAAPACKSGDTVEVTSDSVKAQVTADSIHQATIAATPDTGSTSATATVTAGTAKPNPAKKRGKGSVVFQQARSKNYDRQYSGMTIAMDNQGIYNRAEIRPSYPGGQAALEKFIQNNIVYPEAAIDNGVEGDVDVVFAVDENGKVYTPMIKGSRVGYGLDEAATSVVSKMPKWNPGQVKGKNVKSYYTLPVSFRINQ